MNNSIKSSTRFGLAAAIATITLATAACGTEQATEPQRSEAQQSRPAPPAQRSAMSADAAERAGLQAERERAARAERADALRWAHGHPTATRPDYPGQEMWLPKGG
jgi:hypothetical protein